METNNQPIQALFDNVRKARGEKTKLPPEEITDNPDLTLSNFLVKFYTKYNLYEKNQKSSEYKWEPLEKFIKDTIEKSKQYQSISEEEILLNSDTRAKVMDIKEIFDDLNDLWTLTDKYFRHTRIEDNPKFRESIDNYINTKNQHILKSHKYKEITGNRVKMHIKQLEGSNEYTDSIIDNIIESKDFLHKFQKIKTQLRQDNTDIGRFIEDNIGKLETIFKYIGISFLKFNKKKKLTKMNDPNGIYGYDTPHYERIFKKILKEPVNHGLNKSDFSIIKSSSERLVDFFNYKQMYINFIQISFKKIFMKKFIRKKNFI